MKILVTGGAGYIGSHTSLQLLKENYEVVVLDNFSNSSPMALQRIQEISGRSVFVVRGDLNDRSVLKKIFADHDDIFAVIHFAALKAVGESAENPLAYYNNNVSGSIVLLEEMNLAKINVLVFSSSCTVYGEPEKVPIDESFSIGHVSSPYGRTKFMVEGIIRDQASANHKLKTAILRYFNPVGAHPSGKIGEDPNGIPDNLVPFVCQVAAGKIEQLKIFGNDYPTPDGTAIRDYLHVEDLADAHLKALACLMEKQSSFTCNLGTGKGSSVLDVVSAFENATGIRIPFEITNRRTGDVSEAWANPAYAERLLGWKASRTLREMMLDAWRWQKNNPNGYDSQR